MPKASIEIELLVREKPILDPPAVGTVFTELRYVVGSVSLLVHRPELSAWSLVAADGPIRERIVLNVPARELRICGDEVLRGGDAARIPYVR